MDITKLPEVPPGYSWDWHYYKEEDNFVIFLKRPNRVSIKFHESGYWETTNKGRFGKCATQEDAVQYILGEETNSPVDG